MTEKQLSHYLKLAKDLSEQYNYLKSKEPYHINVIDELHANENAHTRILIRLLLYKQSGRYPILESFLSLLDGWAESGLVVGSPIIETNSEYIDGLIESPNQYAVIIENKIHWASDQYKQIETYVKRVKRHGVPPDKIWVVYLTSDGNKVVKKYSYTDEAERIIQDRFITINYRYDILPWLKDVILPNCVVKEEWLITALKQYIDHLEGLLGLRSTQKTIQKTMENSFLKMAGLSDNMDPTAKYKAIKQLEDRFSSLLQLASNCRVSFDVELLNSFKSITKEYFEKEYPDRPFTIIDQSSLGYLQVRPVDWPQLVHFEWIPFRGEDLVLGNNLTIVLHIEPTRSNPLTTLVNGLKTDSDFASIPGRAEGITSRSTSTYLSITKQLDTAFVYQSSQERMTCLSGFYDEICQSIRFIDKYLGLSL